MAKKLKLISGLIILHHQLIFTSELRDKELAKIGRVLFLRALDTSKVNKTDKSWRRSDLHLIIPPEPTQDMEYPQPHSPSETCINAFLLAAQVEMYSYSFNALARNLRLETDAISQPSRNPYGSPRRKCVQLQISAQLAQEVLDSPALTAARKYDSELYPLFKEAAEK